jgi:two-component system sensor histidine kinase RegB
MTRAMASLQEQPARRRSDRLRLLPWQGGVRRPEISDAGDGRLWDWAQARRGLRLRTLVLLRWVAIAGQVAAVLWVAYGLHFHTPVAWCLLVIAAAAWMNLSVSLSWPGVRLAGEREATLQLAFDLVELTVLLDLTGGLSNPFALLLVAPVVVAAATLPARYAVMLGVLALAADAFLGLWSAPLPWTAGEVFDLPIIYQVGDGVALGAGVVFTAAYAWQAAAEAQRMELALAATQAVLAREQRLSALGGLAAAAAHELGTPLATIQVVTKEMARELEPGPLLDDVQLLMGQAERCRGILKKLSQEPDTSDMHHARLGLSQLLDEVAEPYRGEEILIDCEVSCAPGAAILEVRRLPEVMHGLSAFVENATDFAESVVELNAYYDPDQLVIEVRDDGPGFPPEVLSKLGQPYITTRSHGEGSRSGHHGMGLGFFIAKTLLERTGATVDFRNAKRGGATICCRWRRDRIEAPEPA